MRTLEILLLVFGETVAIVVIALAFHEWGYRKGLKLARKIGSEEGRRAADNWWIRAEEQIDRERQKIWRNEAS